MLLRKYTKEDVLNQEPVQRYWQNHMSVSTGQHLEYYIYILSLKIVVIVNCNVFLSHFYKLQGICWPHPTAIWSTLQPIHTKHRGTQQFPKDCSPGVRTAWWPVYCKQCFTQDPWTWWNCWCGRNYQSPAFWNSARGEYCRNWETLNVAPHTKSLLFHVALPVLKSSSLYLLNAKTTTWSVTCHEKQ